MTELDTIPLQYLKKRRDKLYLMQIALKDYQKPAEEKKYLAKSIKSELDELNKEIAKRIRKKE